MSQLQRSHLNHLDIAEAKTEIMQVLSNLIAKTGMCVTKIDINYYDNGHCVDLADVHFESLRPAQFVKLGILPDEDDISS